MYVRTYVRTYVRMYVCIRLGAPVPALQQDDGPCGPLYMRNLLGWLETRLAQITLNYIKIA